MKNRQSQVALLGFVPQSQALKYMADTDYLLLTMTNDISVPGKLFEYMAAKKPILALAAPGSEVDRILEETAAGVVAAPDEPEAITRMLMQAFTAWVTSEKAIEPRGNLVARYERPRLAAEYGRLMRDIN